MVALTMIHQVAGAAPALGQRLRAAARAVWHELEVIGELRAAGELQRLANGYALSQPELAARLQRTANECEAEARK